VSSNRLVTSGAVVLAIEELQKSDLVAVVLPAGGGDELRVTGMQVHAAYRDAFQEAFAARRQLEKTGKGAGTSPKESTAGGTAPNNDRISAQARLDRAYASQARYDVGLLEVDDVLHHVLAPLFAAPVTVNERLRLAGLPFPIDHYRASDPGPADRVEQYTFAIAPEAGRKFDPSQFTLDFSGDLARRNWSGSPILNSDGKVVAIYSRPLTGAEGSRGAAGGPGLSHAVTPVARLRDIAPELR
jgi:hypothetical protein